MLLICIAFFAFQTAFSHWWLARFRFGPMEWLWRALTYGERPAFRRSAGSCRGRINSGINGGPALCHRAPHRPIIDRVTAPYVPLRVFSSFTMLEGAMEPKTIAAQAARLGFPAIALTDRNGLYAAMPFTDACVDKGVQPIVGALLAVARPPELGVAGNRLAGAARQGRSAAMRTCANWCRPRTSTGR